VSLRAVIFDLGDTLLDNRQLFARFHELNELWPERIYKQLKGRGYHLPDRQRVVEVLHSTLARLAPFGGNSRAVSLPEILRAAWEDLALPISEADTAACVSVFYEVFDPCTVPDPQARPLLQELQECGLLLASVSNTIWEGARLDEMLGCFGLLPYLQVRIYSSEAGYVKPHPAIFHQALEGLGISAAQAVFVGDNLQADVVGAQGVGMKAIWKRVSPTQIDPSELGITPDGRIHALAELPAELDRVFPGWRGEG